MGREWRVGESGDERVKKNESEKKRESEAKEREEKRERVAGNTSQELLWKIHCFLWRFQALGHSAEKAKV